MEWVVRVASEEMAFKRTFEGASLVTQAVRVPCS